MSAVLYTCLAASSGSALATQQQLSVRGALGGPPLPVDPPGVLSKLMKWVMLLLSCRQKTKAETGWCDSAKDAALGNVSPALVSGSSTQC